MKYKNILFALLVLSLVCLSIQSISAENMTDMLEIDENISCSDDLSMDSDDMNEESDETLSASNQVAMSEISSDPLPNIESGVVSGGVDFTHIHPWAPSDSVNGNRGNITYNIPAAATNIKSAYVYVNVYSGSGGTSYGAYANTTIKSANVERQLGNEYLWSSTSSQDGVNYVINDHVNRVYSDYMIFYNVTEMLQGLNGTQVSLDVVSYPLPGKSFDGRIKLISLFVAWDDGDSDEIYYWLNAGQAWTDDTENGISHTFDGIPDLDFSNKLSTLINVGVSSTDALYLINGENFYSESGADEYITGAYYQYHKWDVSNHMEPGTLEVGYKAVGGAYTPSFKTLVSILTIQDIPTYDADEAQISIIPEFSEVPSAYAGTNNVLTVKITTKDGKYDIKLLADGRIVNATEVNLNDGLNTIFLTDPTDRGVDEFTVNGAENRKVNYTVEVSSNGNLINSSSIIIPILYNGNLGKNLAYPKDGINPFMNLTVTGDIVIDIQGNKNYISANVANRTEVWNVGLDANSVIVKSFIYIPYYEFNSKNYDEDENMFEVTFNDINVVPINLYRDQSNLGKSYYSGYGVLVYDVTALVRNGENRLQLNKKYDTPAVFPSALIYMYNTTGSDYIKEIYISNGADLLDGISGNVANRTVHSDSKIDVNSMLTSNATLYVFASSPQPYEADLIFNGREYQNIWNSNSTSYEAYSLDITDCVDNSNNVSFVATGDRIIALQQMIVLTKKLDVFKISLESEYPNTCYAGTCNYITVKIDAIRENRVTARLLADGIKVNETEIDLIHGFNEFTLIDPTERPVDEFTVNGAENRKVNYTLQLVLGNEVIGNSSVSLSILYNGNFSKDMAYPSDGINPFLNITVNGDVVVDVKDDSTYLADLSTKRTDIWNIDLDDESTMVKALVYVPYNSLNTNLVSDLAMFSVKFNGNSIAPVALYRDQSNLGRNGAYLHGLLVYDITDLIINGINSFELNKVQPTPGVYPSTLIYMYNVTGSALVKNVYISNGADLLSDDSNRMVHADSAIYVNPSADVAKLYVFAANAQDSEGSIVFNGKLHENVWRGSAYSTDLYVLDISNTINDTNSISFVAEGNSILALQQMIVTTQKSESRITASDLTVLYGSGGSLIIGLNEANGRAIPDAKLTVLLNGDSTVLTTNGTGQASLTVPNDLSPKTYEVFISFDSTETHMPSNATATLVVEKLPSQITASQMTVVYNTNNRLIVGISEKNGAAITNAKITMVLNGVKYEAKTDSKGKATFTVPKSLVPKAYEAGISFAGDDIHVKSSAKTKITVKKASVSLTANAKTFKAKVKTKKYAVTLKDNAGKAMKKVQLTLKVKGKTFKATTDKNGKATFKITKLTKKGKYTATVAYNGDKCFNKLTKKVKITVKK